MSNKKSLLLLSPFFFPEQISTGKYNSCLSEELVLQGVDVSVVCSHPLFPSWQVEPTDAQMLGVSTHRGGEGLRYPASLLLRRAVLEMWFAVHVLKCWLFKRIKADVVVPVFPPSLFFFVLALFIPKRIRKVGIVHDLQGVYADKAKGLLGRVVGSAIHFVESRCFKACDKLIFLSVSMTERAIAEYGLDREKCVVCYPFVALPACKEQPGSNLVSMFDNDKLHLVYSGALGDKQKPDGLFAFMQTVAQQELGVQCHIFSAGPHFDRLKALHHDCAMVAFHDLVPVDDLDELYARSDVQVIPQELGTGDGSLPSKLPNLMAAGVPVFVVCDAGSEVGDLVLEAQAGVVANTWDPVSLAQVFAAQRTSLVNEGRVERKLRLRNFVAHKFSIERVVEEVLKG
jgi:glycosyltransferase involved in cell wall biosynthesis